jgi:single-strand DNA-binding protein
MANFNINKVILGGRLTADIELKATPSGVAVAQFTIATNRRGSKEPTTDFINCVAWRQTAEFVSKYFTKGSSICVVGELQQRSWEDKNGGKRYATEVIVSEALFVDSKSDAQGVGTASPNNYIPDAYKQPQTANFEAVSVDDDLPF